MELRFYDEVTLLSTPCLLSRFDHGQQNCKLQYRVYKFYSLVARWRYIQFPTLLIPFPRREEALNTTFSQSEFTLDQGERLLKGMQDLREELNSHGGAVSRLVEEARNVRPVKQRRSPITRPIRAETVCAYKHANVSMLFIAFFSSR